MAGGALTLCAGCPHRGALFALRRVSLGLLSSKKPYFCNDEGCFVPAGEDLADTVDAMQYATVDAADGQPGSAVDPKRKLIAYVGDTSKLLRGMPGVQRAVSLGCDITICALGGVMHSETHGCAANEAGAHSAGLDKVRDIEATLQAWGVGHIAHADAFDFLRSLNAVRAALNYPGPSAIVFSGNCARMSPHGKPATVRLDSCTGCRACVSLLDCPAMGVHPFEEALRGRMMRIDPDLCTGCGLCIPLCPCWAIECETASDRSAAGAGGLKLS